MTEVAVVAKPYDVVEVVVPARPVAGVGYVPHGRVGEHFGRYLDQVYAAQRAGVVKLDGQNVFIYRSLSGGVLTVDFCVGLSAPFAGDGVVVPLETPSGAAATTTHWGDYGGIGGANRAVEEWCRASGRTLAGPSWEVYGHWSDDPALVRTDVYHLLK